MIEPVFDKDGFKVLTVFSISPGSRYKRNELKEMTRLNNVPLDNVIVRLVNCGILRIEKNLYQLSFEKEETKKLIEIVSQQYKELRELPLSVFFLLADAVDVLSAVKGIEVYLFGSYAKLVYREKSDVDLAVILKAGQKTPDYVKLSMKLEKVYGKKVQIHDFESEGFYKNKKDPLVSEILRNGVRLL
ncbi:nucleotidyltransferase family protein [Methanocella sp. MCL-LM]|uniref:nucleotidyltransferase family protein n=1 Tax=Methanocella sp. MCL-LM TaxID=3412035 RepID=UPI003C765A4C